MDTAQRQSLLASAQSGDARALGPLLECFRPYVRAIVHHLRGGQVPARIDDSDLIQDALLEAARSFAGFQGTSLAEFTVWLRRIAVRTAQRVLRGLVESAKRDPAREQDLGPPLELASRPDEMPSASAIRHEQADQLAAVLAQLPEDMQLVVLYRVVDGLPHAAIAERLGRTPAAVRMLYLRALRRLRELWPD
jgi:RNA polymerase sigma-70 factor (ECF subfamily)